MLTLEAEIGPVKYIAALAVDWGITDQVETSKAVRWVILLLIVVFDPLAVLLLIAANQSLMRRFPPEAPKPQEVIDLEKPDEEGVDLKWNEMMDKSNTAAQMEQATEQLKDWKEKLEAFNKKVPKPEEKPVEIVQKKTEPEEIDADYRDPAEIIREIEKEKEEEAKQKQLEEFKKREQEELQALEEYSRKAREEVDNSKDGFDLDEVAGFEDFNKKPEPTTVTVEEALKMPEAESVETPIQERIKPDLTEVIEPEEKLETHRINKPNYAAVWKEPTKEVEPPKPKLSNWQRAELLDNFHEEHGNFEDAQEYVQNEEQNEKSL